jgi:glycosyltransferase involved in cell wall biosynthesis
MTEGPRSKSRRPVRVLLLSPVGEIGGAERVLLDFIASTRKAEPNLTFHLITFMDGPLPSAARELGASASVLALPPPLSALGDGGLLHAKDWGRGLKLLYSLPFFLPMLLAFVRRLRLEIRARAPDIVHSNGLKAHFISGAATPAGIPLVWHMHDFLSERPLASRLLKFIGSRASIAIANSAAVAEDTRRNLPSLRVSTILNAVDLEHFSPGTSNGPLLDRLAGMNPASVGALRIGLIATYARWKGQEVFLRAAHLVRRALPDRALRFYIIGGPIYANSASQFTSEELHSLILDLGLATTAALIPFQNDVPSVLRSLDIVVHASTRPEPFGRVIVEAMACARPIIVASAGGTLEIVRAEVTALTHIPGDIDGLAYALIRLIGCEPLRGRLADAACRVAISDFSHMRLGPSLVALYDSLRRPANLARTLGQR